MEAPVGGGRQVSTPDPKATGNSSKAMHTLSSAVPYCDGLRFGSLVPWKPRNRPTEIFHSKLVCSDFKRSLLVRCPSPAGPLQLLQACRVIDIYKYLFLSPWQPGPWLRARKATGMNSRRARRPMASAEAARRRPRHPHAKTGQLREVPPPPRLPRPPPRWPRPAPGRCLLAETSRSSCCGGSKCKIPAP